jgi:hypothetical protein
VLQEVKTLTNYQRENAHYLQGKAPILHAISVESAHKLSKEKTLTICKAKHPSSMFSVLQDVKALTNCQREMLTICKANPQILLVLSVERCKNAHKLSKRNAHHLQGKSPNPPCAQC